MRGVSGDIDDPIVVGIFTVAALRTGVLRAERGHVDGEVGEVGEEAGGDEEDGKGWATRGALLSGRLRGGSFANVTRPENASRAGVELVEGGADAEGSDHERLRETVG